MTDALRTPSTPARGAGSSSGPTAGTATPGPGAKGPTDAPVAGTPRRQSVLGALVSTPQGVIGSVLVALVVGAAVLGPLLAPHGFAETNFAHPFQVPRTVGYPLGTDDLGRDILSRLLHGVRASMIVGLLTIVLAVGIGTPLGLLAGYWRPADLVVSRLTDVALAFPFLVLAVGLTAIAGASLTNAALALGIANIPTMVRVVRGETLRLRESEFVKAAIATDASAPRILGLHILPGAVSAIIVQATVIMPVAVIGEATLSFLGLGIQPPSPSLGIMLSDAQQYIYRSSSAAIFPGLAIVLICLAFNIFGDALRDAFDPSVTKGSRR
ncbi:ABC transporter permease [Brachybacterium sp. GCM10030267]|uniref:ABC transporter permease n=1 Tax=Brachybacterium sp. GCM10030267 TaxID=3273381 RepID=UPI0036181C8E